ncbi:hypothetical protein [Bacillus phage vB_BanS-Thrax5]|nr:hypothetical protein [Bacillus phage vB_BanS-Thrax5]
MAKKDNKIKNLTLVEMKKQEKLLKEQDEVFIDINGTTYKVLIDKHFLQTKRNALLDDLLKFFDAGHKNQDLVSIATPYTSLLLIKHFTNLDIPDDLEEGLDYLNVLMNLKALAPIINSMPTEEVVDLYDSLKTSLNQISENMFEAIGEAQDMFDGIENPEVKALYENGTAKDKE